MSLKRENASLNKRVLSCFLKMFWESFARITRGRLLQRRGAACEKALSPWEQRLLSVTTSRWSSAERSERVGLNTFTIGTGPSHCFVLSSWCVVRIYSALFYWREVHVFQTVLSKSIALVPVFLWMFHKPRDHLQITLTPVVYFQVPMQKHPWLLWKGGGLSAEPFYLYL